MRTVFFVDDEPWALIGLERLIDWKQYGFEICGSATNGAKAWDEIVAMRPDVIFTDIRMPGLSGLELLRRIHVSGLSCTVVMISGYAEFEYAREAVRYGAFDYLVKQVQTADLTDCLKRINKMLDLREGLAGSEDKTTDSSGETAQETGKEITFFHSGSSASVRALIADINQHYRSPMTVGEYAQKLGISQGHLSELIKKETGHTYSELLQKRRIEKAKELLANTDQTVYKIAEETGFCDYYYFAKSFRKATGQTPTEFRKKNHPESGDEVS
ncbi:MAG: response regulator transcription factor [Lachnospiraceae bacterium]|jgi:two-component system response regulator YesN